MKNNVQQTIANAGMTQQEVGDLIGVARHHVARWCGDSGRVPTESTARMISLVTYLKTTHPEVLAAWYENFTDANKKG